MSAMEGTSGQLPPDAAASSEPGLWRVSTVLLVPMYFQPTPDGRFPNPLTFYSRLNEQAKRYGATTVAIRKPTDRNYKELYGSNPQVELVELVADIPGDDMTTAVETFGPTFGTLIDLMSFEMGVTFGVGQMTVTDITPPVSIGEECAFTTYTVPPFDRNAQSVDMGAIQGALFGELPGIDAVSDSKTAAVLRWFVKALGTNLLHDQFIFLWIALEILCDASDVRVVEPYVGQCHHQITNCPICNEPTTRLVRGATLRSYLERFGISDEQSKELWRMRQLMHGAIPFDSQKLAGLEGLVQPLRAVVATGLKARLGKGAGDAPIIAATGPSVHPAIAVGGTGAITENDIKPLLMPQPPDEDP